MTPTTMNRTATALAYPVLPAEDLSRARRFYHETLGFQVEDMPPERQFIIHAGGGTRILVYERPRTKAEHTAMMLQVDDLPAVMDEMRSHGVHFEEYDMPGMKTVNGVLDMPSGQGAWFTDPEGNIISVVHMS